ncbi:agmatinase [Cysteiniphilum sp. QT6929]|uniref:agmatinase n=1 Tax=Cysteiniphilum sp. QT6929 TaxID=2975055 RepID=UPI0024B3294C|nr:agmatinase [Cysteiniphilum sp. QT6929]WHN65855.1 agmatinase [Cysteiniphilum sp. QT6929]
MSELVDAAIARKALKGSQFEMTYGGVTSFMRRNYTKDLTNVDVAVSGVPFDLAVTYRSGARLGPRAIRAASVQLAELTTFPWGFNPFDELAVIDYGDCFLAPHNPLTTPHAIQAHIKNLLDHNVFPLTFGGDHYITYPILKAMAEKYGKGLSVIHFDAHCDTWRDDDEDSMNHGTMFYKAIKNGIVDPKHSAQIGIRTWNQDFMGMNVLDAPFVHEHGVKTVIERVKQIVGDRPTYITFDIDCLDPAFAPGTGTPVSGGLSSAQGLAILRGLTGLNLIGADVVEVAPAYDHAEITAIAAAHVACDMICLLAHDKKIKKIEK